MGDEELVFIIRSVADGVEQGYATAAGAIDQLGQSYDSLSKTEERAQKSLEESAERAKKSAGDLARSKEAEGKSVLDAARAKLSDLAAMKQQAQAQAAAARTTMQAVRDKVQASYAQSNADQALRDGLAETTRQEAAAAQATDDHTRAAGKAMSAAQQYAAAQKDIAQAHQRQENSALAAGAAILMLTQVYKRVTSALDAATAAYVQNRNALVGLKSIAEGMGTSFGGAKKALLDFTADGLIPVGDAATALKNLLARGFDLSQAIQMLDRLKDSAAFGRQSSLQLGEAVSTATEGLKNENSILVDNAGVTKNVSAMWRDYAATIGKSANTLTLAEKRQAEYNGIMTETRHQVGDAAKYAREFSGSQAALTAATTRLSVALGQANAQGVAPFNALLTQGINGVEQFARQSGELISVVLTSGKVFGAGVVAVLLFNGSLKSTLASLLATLPGFSAVSASAKAMWTSITGPIGWVVGGVSLLVGVLATLSGQAEQNRQQMEALNEEIQQLGTQTVGAAQLVDRFESLKNKTQLTKDETAELSRISEQLVSTYSFRADGVNKEGKGIVENVKLMREQLTLQQASLKLKMQEAETQNTDAYKKAVTRQAELLQKNKQLSDEIPRLEAQYRDLRSAIDNSSGQDFDAALGVSDTQDKIAATKAEQQKALAEIQQGYQAIQTQINNSIELAKLTAATRGQEIPVALQQAMAAKMQELSEADTHGAAISSGVASTFIDRYFGIQNAAGLAESKVAEIQALQQSILAQLAVSSGDSGSAGILAKQILGKVTDEGTLAQAMQQGQLLRAKLDSGVATPGDMSAYNQTRSQIISQITAIKTAATSALSDAHLPTDGIIHSLDQLGDAFGQTAEQIEAAGIAEKVSKLSMGDFVAEVQNAADAADDLSKAMSDWANLQSAIDVVKAGADASDNYSDALAWLAAQYGVTTDQALESLDAYQADADMSSTLIDIKVALAEAEIGTAQATISAMQAQGAVTSDQASVMIASLDGVLTKLQQLNGKRIALKTQGKDAAIVQVTGGGQGLFQGGAPAWSGYTSQRSHGGGYKASGGGGGGSARAERQERQEREEPYKNEAYEREMHRIDRLKKLNQLTARDEIAALEYVLKNHVKIAKEREEIEEKLYDAKQALQKSDLEYRKSMDQVTLAEEVGLVRAMRNQYQYGTDAWREANKQLYALQKQQRQQILELGVYYDRLTLEQQREVIAAEIQLYKAGTQARIDLEKKLYDIKKQIRDRDVGQLNKLGDALMAALRERYNAQRALDESRINLSIKGWQDWAAAQQKAISDQVAALDELTQAEDRGEEERKRRRNIAALEQKIQYEADAYNRQKLQEELARHQEELQKWLLQNEREDLKAALGRQAQAATDLAQKEQAKLQAKLEANGKYYDELIKDEKIRAEAEKLLVAGSQQDILKLIKSYVPDYDALGQTLGEQLVDGFVAKTQDIAKWFEGLNGQIVRYQRQMASVANQAAETFWQVQGGAAASQTPAAYSAVPSAAPPVLHVYFNQPIKSPAEVTRELERLAESLVRR